MSFRIEYGDLPSIVILVYWRVFQNETVISHDLLYTYGGLLNGGYPQITINHPSVRGCSNIPSGFKRGWLEIHSIIRFIGGLARKITEICLWSIFQQAMFDRRVNG